MIAIVGGGITGLAAAHRITERLGRGHCVVLESAREVGGKIHTHASGGMLLEDGPDAFLAAKPAAAELCRALGLGDRLIATAPAARQAWIRRGTLLHPLPAGLTGLVPARLGPLVREGTLSIGGRLRAALEVFVPRQHGGEESVEDFVRRRFGGEVWSRIAEPLLAGIGAGDGRGLSLPILFPRLAELERTHRSLLLAALRTRRPATPAGFLTLKGGLGELVDALVARIGPEAIRTNAAVRALRRKGAAWSVVTDHEEIAADEVLLATPAWAAAPLVAPHDATLAARLEAIPFSSSAVVTLAWPAAAVARPLAGSGWLVPASEHVAAIAVSVSTNKFPGRAPGSVVLLRVFLGRRGEELLRADDRTLVDAAVAEAAPPLGLAGAPFFTRVARWPRGLPLYTLGHAARVAEIEARAAALPGLHLAGASYRGLGIPDCIGDGLAAANRLALAAGVAA